MREKENELLEDMKGINLEEKMIEEINIAKLKIMKKNINLIIIGHNSMDDNDYINHEEIDYDYMIEKLEIEYRFFERSN